MGLYKNFLGEVFYYAISYSEELRPNSFFELNMCGMTPPNTKYEIFRDKNPVYVFEYVDSGVGWIDTQGKHYKVEKGDFYLLKRGFTGHYYADRDEPYKKIWANVLGELIDSATAIYGFTEPVTVCHCNDDRIKRAMTAIHNVMSKATDLVEAHRVASMKLIEMLSVAKNSERVNDSMSSNRVRPAEFIRSYLSDHIYDEVRLPDLASQLYMHEATVIRIFREAYGVTPIKYLNKLRIDAAKGMLYDGAGTKFIAETLMFSDPAYFSNCFKKETGMTPTQYRKSIGK